VDVLSIDKLSNNINRDSNSKIDRQKEILAILQAVKALHRFNDIKKASNGLYLSCKTLLKNDYGFLAIRIDENIYEFPVWDMDEKIIQATIITKSPLQELFISANKKLNPIYQNEIEKLDHSFSQVLYNAIISPILLDEEPVGFLVLYNKEGGFDEHDSFLVRGFSEISSIILRSGQEREEQVMSESELELQKELFTEIGHISSELAHDLRSPLQTIQNAAYLLELKPDRIELFSLIKESLAYATSILDSFRDYYRGHEIAPLETDIKPMIEQAVQDIDPPDNIEVDLELSDIGKILVDPTKIRRAINNLVKNAYEAMPEGGILTVRLYEQGELVKIEIVDTGIGIPKKIQENLYQPFGSNKPGGSGLGLPSAKRIIESHGGRIDYETKVDKGTVFIVTLPKKIKEN
jgi:signal transduction histidine kinase